MDRWILARLAAVTAQVDEAYEDFQFARATETLYHFVWDELCDWYLELAKLVLRGRRARGRSHPARPGGGAGRRPAPPAPGGPLRHRGALDGAHRGRVGRDRGLAVRSAGRGGCRQRRRHRDRRGRRPPEARHRDPQVPLRPGAAPGPAGPGAAVRSRGHAARPTTRRRCEPWPTWSRQGTGSRRPPRSRSPPPALRSPSSSTCPGRWTSPPSGAASARTARPLRSCRRSRRASSRTPTSWRRPPRRSWRRCRPSSRAPRRTCAALDAALAALPAG